RGLTGRLAGFDAPSRQRPLMREGTSVGPPAQDERALGVDDQNERGVDPLPHAIALLRSSRFIDARPVGRAPRRRCAPASRRAELMPPSAAHDRALLPAA